MKRPRNFEAVDVSRGEIQCPSVTPNGHDGHLCCALKDGHKSPHEDAHGYWHCEWYDGSAS